MEESCGGGDSLCSLVGRAGLRAGSTLMVHAQRRLNSGEVNNNTMFWVTASHHSIERLSRARLHTLYCVVLQPVIAIAWSGEDVM